MKLLHLILPVIIIFGCSKPPAPKPIFPIPTPQQVEWQKLETYAFIHFGLNTFNDLEWGFGDTPAETFNPTNLDVNQWVTTLKSAGMKAIILTIKHHDGFCLWPTKYGEYNIKNSGAAEGSDILRDLLNACKENNLKVGIYISPWDRNHAEYGKEGYIEYFHKTIEETVDYCTEAGVDLFEFWFDGANGGDGYYGGANERRSINAQIYYDYERAAKTIHSKYPNAMIFGGTVPTIRWIGNEAGWAGETNWSMFASKNHDSGTPIYGNEDGQYWLPGEVDVSVRPGWFYHKKEDHQLRSLSTLVDYYYQSVGRNATLLLNFPVEHSGRIPQEDSTRIMEWRRMLDEQFANDLALAAEISSSNDRGYGYKAENINDGDWDSYWATSDNVNTGDITLSFEEPATLNTLLLQEYIPLGQRVAKFSIEYTDKNGHYTPISTSDSTTTIGYKRIIRFDNITTKQIKINFERSRGPLVINNISAYLAPVVLDAPKLTRDISGNIHLTSAKGTDIYYTTDDSEPSVNSEKYQASFSFNKKGTIKAIATDPVSGKQSDILTTILDIPTTKFKIVSPAIDNENTSAFDGDINSTYYLPNGVMSLSFDLGEQYTIKGIKYLSDQSRWGGGAIHSYTIYIDGKKIKSGEFSNIKNNPLLQTVSFEKTKGSIIRIDINAIADDKKRASFAELSIITQ